MGKRKSKKKQERGLTTTGGCGMVGIDEGSRPRKGGAGQVAEGETMNRRGCFALIMAPIMLRLRPKPFYDCGMQEGWGKYHSFPLAQLDAVRAAIGDPLPLLGVNAAPRPASWYGVPSEAWVIRYDLRQVWVPRKDRHWNNYLRWRKEPKP